MERAGAGTHGIGGFDGDDVAAAGCVPRSVALGTCADVEDRGAWRGYLRAMLAAIFALYSKQECCFYDKVFARNAVPNRLNERGVHVKSLLCGTISAIVLLTGYVAKSVPDDAHCLAQARCIRHDSSRREAIWQRRAGCTSIRTTVLL